MENNQNIDGLLKYQMSVEYMEFDAPNFSLIKEAKEKVLARKKPIPSKGSISLLLNRIFSFEIKLYQAGLATLIIVLCVGYYFNETKLHTEPLAEQNSKVNPENSYSVKSTRFLVENFSSEGN